MARPAGRKSRTCGVKAGILRLGVDGWGDLARLASLEERLGPFFTAHLSDTLPLGQSVKHWQFMYAYYLIKTQAF
jgi:hypothetical protein